MYPANLTKSYKDRPAEISFFNFDIITQSVICVNLSLVNICLVPVLQPEALLTLCSFQHIAMNTKARGINLGPKNAHDKILIHILIVSCQVTKILLWERDYAKSGRWGLKKIGDTLSYKYNKIQPWDVKVLKLVKSNTFGQQWKH